MPIPSRSWARQQGNVKALSYWYGLNVSVPQNWYVEILMPDVMVLGGGTFGWWSGHEGRALVNEIYALIKETLESSLVPSTV